MTRLFNSSFEMQLRILLLLSECKEPLTTDKIVCLDFITIYGAEFGISNRNLHGKNRYKFSELPSRRELVQYALKELVLKNFVVPDFSDGFRYRISEDGFAYAFSLESSYAIQYLKTAKKTLESYYAYKEHEMIRMIQDKSVVSLREDSDVLH